MYEFLDKLVSIALPRVRDFHGINPNGFDNFVKKFASVKKAGKAVSKDLVQALTMDKNEREALVREQAEAQAQAAQEQMQEQELPQAMAPLNDPNYATEPKGTDFEIEN